MPGTFESRTSRRCGRPELRPRQTPNDPATWSPASRWPLCLVSRRRRASYAQRHATNCRARSGCRGHPPGQAGLPRSVSVRPTNSADLPQDSIGWPTSLADSRHEIEERFRQMAENIHEIFWVRDARDGRMLYVSPGYEEVWGRTCQSLYDEPRSWIESVHTDDQVPSDRARRAARPRCVQRCGVSARPAGWLDPLDSQPCISPQNAEWGNARVLPG